MIVNFKGKWLVCMGKENKMGKLKGFFPRYKDMVSGMGDKNKGFILLAVPQHGLDDRMEGFLYMGLGRFTGKH